MEQGLRVAVRGYVVLSLFFQILEILELQLKLLELGINLFLLLLHLLNCHFQLPLLFLDLVDRPGHAVNRSWN
jgi:hypothetical protein